MRSDNEKSQILYLKMTKLFYMTSQMTDEPVYYIKDSTFKWT